MNYFKKYGTSGRKREHEEKGLVILCSLLMILLIGCGGKSPTLVGAWTSFPLEWIAENGKLKITINAGFLSLAESFSYKLSDDTSILTTDEGEEITYTRIAED